MPIGLPKETKSLRITNFHLIVSFLMLSTAGFFAYHFLGRPLAVPSWPSAEPARTEAPVPPPAPARAADDAAARRTRELESARADAAARLRAAAKAKEDAVSQGRDVAEARERYVAAQGLFAKAASPADFMAAARAADEAAALANEAPAAETRDEYVVERGDNLWNISKRKDVYGRGAGWVKIWRANEKAVPDFDRLYAGLKLSIPRDQAAR